jgi:hypothetical protein
MNIHTAKNELMNLSFRSRLLGREREIYILEASLHAAKNELMNLLNQSRLLGRERNLNT